MASEEAKMVYHDLLYRIRDYEQEVLQKPNVEYGRRLVKFLLETIENDANVSAKLKNAAAMFRNSKKYSNVDSLTADQIDREIMPIIHDSVTKALLGKEGGRKRRGRKTRARKSRRQTRRHYS